MARIDPEIIERARAVPIVYELHRRGIRLTRSGLELVGPCPVCGGTDRFAVNPGKSIWLCRRCPAGGDVIDLVRHLDHVPFGEAVARLVGLPRTETTTPVRIKTTMAPVRGRDALTGRALALWNEAQPIASTLAECYLVETRKLVLPPDVSPRVLRFHPRCPFANERHPSLLALYQDITTDEPRAIIRTALTAGALKIGRKALGSVRAAAVKLSGTIALRNSLVVGEGVETTLAALMLGFAPAWALGSAGAIATLKVIPGINSLTVLGETNDGGANEFAAKTCAIRWRAARREVYRVTSPIGDDFNDAFMIA